MLYVRDMLGARKVCGIDNTGRSRRNVETHNLSVMHGNILDVRFEDFGVETFYMWIEDPGVEIEVMRRLREARAPRVLIVAYNTQGGCRDFYVAAALPYNPACTNGTICQCLRHQPDRIRRLLGELRDGYVFETVRHRYNNGSGCREAGAFTYFIIRFG